MEKFTKEEKELLEKNPNIQAVLSNQVLYSNEFKERATEEYKNGKSASQIFLEAKIPTEIISKQTASILFFSYLSIKYGNSDCCNNSNNNQSN